MEAEHIAIAILIIIIVIILYFGNPFNKETFKTTILPPAVVEHHHAKTEKNPLMTLSRADRKEDEDVQPMRAPRTSEQELQALL